MNAFRVFGTSREAVGLLAGACLLGARPVQGTLLDNPAWILASIIFLASVAGFVAGGTSASVGLLPSLATRAGAWAAGLAGLVAAAMIAFMGRSTGSTFLVSRAIVGGALSVLPGVFYGTISAAIAAVVFVRPTDKTTALTFPPAVEWALRSVIAAIVGIGVFLPVPPPSRIVQAAPVLPASLRPAVDSFAYSAVPELDTARAARWHLSKIWPLHGLNTGVWALSHDARSLACLTADGRSIRIYDLHAPQGFSSIPVGQRVDLVSFSPNAQRLFFCSAGSDATLAIAEIGTGGVATLPKPKGGLMSSVARLLWWKEYEVLMLAANDRPSILNLDDLEIDPAEEVATWKDTPAEMKVRITREMTGFWSDSPRWQWAFKPFIWGTDPVATGLGMTRHQVLAMSDPERDVSILFGPLATESVKIFPCLDGSKALFMANDTVRICYFDIAPAPPLAWSLAMPCAPGDGAGGGALDKALKAGTLAAVVYAPMINPLNQRVVGPQRGQVKAVVKFKEWKDRSASIYVWRSFAPIADGDVIGDVCAWSEMQPELFSLGTPHAWWAALPRPDQGAEDITKVPTLAERKKQEEAVKAEEEAKRAESEVADAKVKKEREAKAAEEEKKRLAAMPKGAVFSSPLGAQSVPPPQWPASFDPREEQVRSFIRIHHQKSRVGDVAGMISDYAIKVDYFDKGLVTPGWIMQDEQKYHASHTVLEETVIDPIQISKLPKGYAASYQLKSRSKDNVTGRMSEWLFDVNLNLVEIHNGLQISRQRTTHK